MNRRTFIELLTSGSTLAMIWARRLPAADIHATHTLPFDGRDKAERFGDGRDWWFKHRFGLFVHWGLYAIHGWHEQEQWRRRVPRAEYEKLAQQWNPVAFDPNQWLDAAVRTGMSYVCFTAKHHDGFCLWKTNFTSFNTMNTPYGKDVLRQLADACHSRKIPLCLYYSIVDWHHPNYPNESRHHELAPQPGDKPDFARYLEFIKGQIRELCTNYGEIHGIWWDMNVLGYKDPSINALIRQLQPNAIINNRGFDSGDFGTPERDYERSTENLIRFAQRTEACQSIGGESWGYRRDEDYYSDLHLIRSVDQYLARDANYLLNIGPKPDGTISATALDLLERIGKWYQAIKTALVDVEPATELTENRSVLLTRKGTTLYVHICHEIPTQSISLKPLVEVPRRAILLNTGKPVLCSNEMVPSEHAEQKGYLRLHDLPVNEMQNTVMVVQLDFDQLPTPPAAHSVREDGTLTK